MRRIQWAPVDTNGVSKFAGEQYWMIENRVHGRQVVSLRLSNCFGPRMRIRDARARPFLPTGFVMSCSVNALRSLGWGSVAGSQGFVDDVTEAFILAGTVARVLREDRQRRWIAADIFAGLGGSCWCRSPETERITRCETFLKDRALIDIGSYHADDTLFQAGYGLGCRASTFVRVSRSRLRAAGHG